MLITIQFPNPINTSVQVGDMIYVVPTSLAGTVSDTFNIGDLRDALEVGFVTVINNQEGLKST